MYFFAICTPGRVQSRHHPELRHRGQQPEGARHPEEGGRGGGGADRGEPKQASGHSDFVTKQAWRMETFRTFLFPNQTGLETFRTF